MGNNASCKICGALSRLNTSMGRCRQCRTEIPAISVLDERGFIFDWLPFHCCNSDCVRLLALTMEPSDPGARQAPDPVMGAFRPLKYALRRLIVRPGEGFMITPIAKCSLRVEMARETREARWVLCSPFLLEEIRTINDAGLLCPDFGIVAVGDDPDGFLRKAPSMRHFSPRRLGKLTHYGAYRNGNGAFKVAEANKRAFALFVEEFEPDYCAFVREHVEWDWPMPEQELNRDMEIIFKWNRQMDPWRERLR
jgi:hypothetical protein